MALEAMKKFLRKMKIDKKLIKELVDNLKEFNLTELEYQEGLQQKLKFPKPQKSDNQKLNTVVSPNKTVLNTSDDTDGVESSLQ